MSMIFRHTESLELHFWLKRLEEVETQIEYVEYVNDLINNNYERYVNPYLSQDECLEYVKNDFAVAVIQVPGTTVNMYKRTLSSTFLERLGSLGKKFNC